MKMDVQPGVLALVCGETAKLRTQGSKRGGSGPLPSQPFLCKSFCSFQGAIKHERKLKDELECPSFQIFLLPLTLVPGSIPFLLGSGLLLHCLWGGEWSLSGRSVLVVSHPGNNVHRARLCGFFLHPAKRHLVLDFSISKTYSRLFCRILEVMCPCGLTPTV